MSAVTELALAVGTQAACGVLAVSRASYYRREAPPVAGPRKVPVRAPSPRALSAPERQVVLDTLHGARFQDRSPGHVVAALLSEDTWLCSERTMYRLLEAQGETQLIVYSVTGQHVRTLVSGSREAGRHSVTWDGTNDVGQAVASGVYIYRVVTPSGVATERMTLAR